jgi:hypothetical protein
VVAVVRDVVDVAVVRAVAVVAVDVARAAVVPPAVPAPSSAAVPVAVLSTPRTSLLSRPSAPKLGRSELHLSCGRELFPTSSERPPCYSC